MNGRATHHRARRAEVITFARLDLSARAASSTRLTSPSGARRIASRASGARRRTRPRVVRPMAAQGRRRTMSRMQKVSG
jgi:hypothetical protein